MNKPTTKILVCCHKKDIWKSDDVYMPIHVGKAISNTELNIQGDDTGDNISTKNKSYCELTGLYWAWKNLEKVDYIGLCHYRRYFNFSSKFSLGDAKTVPLKNFTNLNIGFANSQKLLKNCDIVLASPKSYPYNLRTDYCLSHLSTDFFTLVDVINNLYPDYSAALVDVMENSNRLNHYNMFLTKYEIFNSYCNWLFPILSECEKRIDISNYNVFQKRIFGYMAERLLIVYVKKNNLKVEYYPITFINDNTDKYNSLYYILKKRYNDFLFFLSKRKVSVRKAEFYNRAKSLYI